MKKEVVAIFDIGKTNKKFFLFDKNFIKLYSEFTQFEPILDDDGFPSEDLKSVSQWMIDKVNNLLKSDAVSLKGINFSTYGASLVHIDKNGKVIAPLYNYTKQLDQNIIDEFYEKYGPENQFTIITGSPNSGMLNAGMQLYWLKNNKKDIFKKIHYSLHLPQYFSYLFSGIPLSEYTSIGCHTALWNYMTNDYHHWVYKEKIDKILPPKVASNSNIIVNYKNIAIKIGVGIHDSSAALLPYVSAFKKNFILVSTGTWSVSLNPFANSFLNFKDVEKNCLNYMFCTGEPIKSSRFFMGNEFTLQIQELSKAFNVSPNYFKTVLFDKIIFLKLSRNFKYHFHWQSINSSSMPQISLIDFLTFEEAYHQLITELVLLQVKNIEVIQDKTKVNSIFVDGGFTENDVYLKILALKLKGTEILAIKGSLGSSLGAAITISDKEFNIKDFKKNYALQNIET